MNDLSELQQLATVIQRPNIALSAGAGSGKTSVIVERIVRIISNGGVSPPCTINNILAVTFTDKAARELKERLVQRLSESGMVEERRQIETAFICTIHALCARLLQENPFEVGLNPGFDVLTGDATNELINRAFHHCVQPGETGHQYYSYLISSINQWSSSVSPEEFLITTVTNVLWELRGAGCFVEDLSRRIGVHGEEYKHSLQESMRSVVVDGLASTRATLKVLETLRNSIPVRLIRQIESVINLMHRFVEEPQLLECINLAREIEKSVSSLMGQEGLSEGLKTALFALQSSVEFAKYLKPVDEHLQEQASTLASSLMSLIVCVWNNYTESKSTMNAVDTDDLQELAVRLLEGNPKVADRYRARFMHVIVDEFQDTSRIQMRLLNCLRQPLKASGNQFFVVGDRQQSIYSFRNADPRLFTSLCREFNSTPLGAHLTLEDNYRTHPNLLRTINGLFSNLWANSEQPLQPQVAKRPAKDGLLRFEILASQGLRGDYYRRDEGTALANRIIELVNTGSTVVCDSGHEPRPVQYGDIAIVMRSLKDVRHIEQAFLRANIPFFVIGGVRGYYSRTEIRDVINVLTLVIDPDDDLSFSALLRSPFVGLSMDHLTKLVLLAESDRQVTPCLYSAVDDTRVTSILGDEHTRRIREITRLLDGLRELHVTMSPSELLQNIIDATGYDTRLLARVDGRRKLANLRKLQALAASEEGYGVRSFIHKLRNLNELSDREGDAPTEEEDANVVRILTIHSAKGLEFPVVAVADLSRPLMRRENRPFVCDGPTQLVGVSIDGKPDILYQLLVRGREARERAEYIRLLYVAMTRARDYLILSGDLIPVKGFNWASLVFPSIGILEAPRAPQIVQLVGGHTALLSPIMYYTDHDKPVATNSESDPRDTTVEGIELRRI